METWKLSFNGRALGAIGIFYPITLTVDVEDGTPIEDVKALVYRTHEHIFGMHAELVGGAK